MSPMHHVPGLEQLPAIVAGGPGKIPKPITGTKKISKSDGISTSFYGDE